MPFISYMTDNEAKMKKQSEERIGLALGPLDVWLHAWKKRDDRILTPAEIGILRYIAEHNLRATPLTHNQQQMKTEIHQKLRDSLCDIERMIDYEFMGTRTRWNPAQFFPAKSRHPFDSEKIWREDFPAKRVCKFIKCLVEMFGDDYAHHLTKAIEDGLRSRPENDGYLVEVRPVKYLKQSFTTPL